MRYVALLRGINVGGNKGISMKELKALFESLGNNTVSTYLNSGNVIFDSDGKKDALRGTIEASLKEEFGFDVPTLVKTQREMRVVADAIPRDWRNDDSFKTDVAYLFPEIDNEGTIELLPIKREYIDIRYVKGAIFWTVDRKDYNKSRINKVIGHEYYQLMTIRNVNTARYLGGHARHIR